MTYEEWIIQERSAGRFHDPEVAKPAWEAAQREQVPPQVYQDSRINEAVRKQFSSVAE